jgi:hypothetical protein
VSAAFVREALVYEEVCEMEVRVDTPG